MAAHAEATSLLKHERLRVNEIFHSLQGEADSVGFRTVFVLRDVEGLSTEETAQALELSIPAVKSRLLRARLQLRERLNRFFQKKASGDGDQ